MYRWQSNWAGDFTLQLTRTDLVRRGYIFSEPACRDCIYDLLVQLAITRFESIQVKTLDDWAFSTSTRRSKGKSERVSLHGKHRNSYRYADSEVHWIVGVNPETEQLYYYKLDTYKHYDTIDVRKVPADTFPVNTSMQNHTIGVRTNEPTLF